jgi:hypothetical protein
MSVMSTPWLGAILEIADNGDSEFVVNLCFRGVGGLDLRGLA